jgi:Transposase
MHPRPSASASSRPRKRPPAARGVRSRPGTSTVATPGRGPSCRGVATGAGGGSASATGSAAIRPAPAASSRSDGRGWGRLGRGGRGAGRHAAWPWGWPWGARLRRHCGLTVSRPTRLRMILRAPCPAIRCPQVRSVDDCALRKRHPYGPILVDLAQGRPLALLPDREATTVAQWLKAHPGVAVVVRDRAEAYAEAARLGAPAACQVADRFQLRPNLTAVRTDVVRAHAPQGARLHARCPAVPTPRHDPAAPATGARLATVPLAPPPPAPLRGGRRGSRRTSRSGPTPGRGGGGMRLPRRGGSGGAPCRAICRAPRAPSGSRAMAMAAVALLRTKRPSAPGGTAGGATAGTSAGRSATRGGRASTGVWRWMSAAGARRQA